MKLTKKIILGIDLFGHPVNLNFDQKGETHRTLFGGAATIIMIIISLYNFVNSFNKVISYGNNSTSQIQQAVDLGALGDVMFEETGFKVYFFIFKNNIRNNLPIEEFRTYLDVYWEEEFKDWNRDINKFKRIESNWCTQDFFGYDPQSTQIWNSWNNQLILCPEFTNKSNNFILSDDGYGMVSHQINIKFQRCNSSLRNDCKNDTMFNEFIKDMAIQTLTNQFIIDLTQMESLPVIKSQKLQQIFYPSTIQNQVQVQQFFLKQNFYQTKDDMFYFGQTTLKGKFYDINWNNIFQEVRNETDTLFLKINLSLDNSAVQFNRQIFHVLALMADLGGTQQAIMIIFQIITFYVAKHSFLIALIRDLYFAKTKNEDLFRKTKKLFKKKNKYIIDESKSSNLSPRSSLNLKNNRIIKLSLIDFVLLFFQQGMCESECRSIWPKYDKLKYMYDEGKLRMNSELNIVKIAKSIRNLKVLVKSSLMNKEIRLQIEHAKNSVIDLDKFDVETQQIEDNITQDQTINKFFGKRETNISQNFSNLKKNHTYLNEESQNEDDENKRSFKKKVKSYFSQKTSNKKVIKKRDVQLVSNSSIKASIDNDFIQENEQNNDLNILQMQMPDSENLQIYLQQLENELDQINVLKNSKTQQESHIQN